MKRLLIAVLLINLVSVSSVAAGEKKQIKMLYYGNSFTGHHAIPLLVKQVTETQHPEVSIDYIVSLSGGKELGWHWEQGTQRYLKLPGLSKKELESTCAEMEKAMAEALKTKDEKVAREFEKIKDTHQQWLQWEEELGEDLKLDYVSLSPGRRDEKGGLDSRYAESARTFAKLAHENGVKPILYGIEIEKLNGKPLEKAPDPGPFMEKARYHAALANELDALVIPMHLAVLKAQQKDPTLTLRYKDDFHLNQTCAYLTACCFYAAMFDRSPVGLKTREINNPGFKGRRDPDGNPKNVVFSEEVATVLQQSAWEAVTEMKKLQKELADQPVAEGW